MPILAIETSCDETAAAVVTLTDGTVRTVSSVVSSQASLHAAWGGVVPALAAREHQKNIVPVIQAALQEAGLTPRDLDALAVTQGPGLMPALVVGVQAAKTLAYAWRKPLLGIHHIEGHIYANFISPTEPPATPTEILFPLLALVVSGGHTELVLIRDHFRYEILGRTEDDAAGEAFDKVAKILGLPYPGGPEVACRADGFQEDTGLRLPRPLIDSGDYRFSFSGLKTAVLYAVRDVPVERRNPRFVAAVCHEFQEAVVDTLVGKTRTAVREYAPRTVTVAGGVSANVRLRGRLREMVAEEFPGISFVMPEFRHSLDNAAMVGSAAVMRWSRLTPEGKERALTDWRTLEPDPNLKLAA